MATAELFTTGYSALQSTILSEISIALETPLSCLGLVSSFIQNGGDSLSALQLQVALRNKHGIRTSVRDIFAASSLLGLTELAGGQPVCDLDRVQQLQLQLPSPAARHERKRSAAGLPPAKRQRRSCSGIVVSAREKDVSIRYPMTEMQISLVQSTQINAGYNVISYLETYRPENIPALKLAWETVLRSEDIFHVSFRVDESGAPACEKKQTPFQWEEVVVRDESSYERAVKNQDVPDDPLRTSFKVITFLPFGAEGKSTVIWRVHHAMIDGVSSSILLSKVRQVLAGKPVKAGPSFGDFSLKLQALQLQGRESAVEFWARQKRDHPSPASELLLATPSDDQVGHSAEIDQVYISSNVDVLRDISKAAGVTLASLYHAAWGLVLSRYTDSNSVLLGTVLSGRNLPIEGVESVVGPLINALPLHISLSPSSTIREYLHSVFTTLLELTSFQWTAPHHGFTRDFSTAISVRFDVPEVTSGPFTLLEHPSSRVCSDVPLSIEVGHCGLIGITYHTKSFSRLTVEKLGAAFTAAFDSMLTLDSTVASCLDSLVSEDQRLTLARMGNWTGKATRHGAVSEDLVSLFVQAAEKNPSLLAVERCSSSLTYAQLHEQSSRVARHISKIVSPGDVICVHADGSVNWIVAIYAILKTGAVYCPFAPALPKAARETNFAATRAKLYLAPDATTKSTRPASCEICLSVEELLLENSVVENHDTLSSPRPTANAYLCFTSGTTGKPKGVLCRHESLVSFQSDFEVRLCAQPGWKIAQFMSPEFDGSIHEIFSALSYGATLVLKDTSRPFDHLKGCDAVILTPTVAKALDPADFRNLKNLYLVGEAVRQNICDMWAGQVQLFNMYGPTEATCGATVKRLVSNKLVTLGGPNPTTRIYILDSQRRLAPVGAIGEIYLAGIQVATGYIGQPTETAARFLPDSINPQFSGEYMYKTGDRAYWNDDGEIMFLGRRDRQVKLRGFRIDLDDLEARMTRAHDKCTAVAVAVKDDYLVALVQPAHLDSDEFKVQIRNHIPAYALPRHIMAVKSFPTTPVGKLDYKAIVAAASSLPAAAAPGMPASASRDTILSTLKTVLGMCAGEHVDLDSSFADLGVNSLLALHLSQRLSRSFKMRIPVSMVLGTATVRGLVEAVASCLQAPETRQVDCTLGEHRVSPIEAEWWQKYQHANTSSFNVTYACELPGTLDRSMFTSAWNTVLRRHRILRCRYASSDLHGLRREYASSPPTARSVEAIDIQREINTPFDIAREDLVRVLLSPTHMLVVISHIICDLTTLKILLQEVVQTYQGQELGSVAKTYSQTTWSTPAPSHNLSFWTEYLSGTSSPQFPVGRIDTLRKSWTGSSYTFQLPRSTHEAMNTFAAREKVTMHQLTLASVALALQHANAHCDMTIGAPYLNRHTEEDQDVIGLFLEPLPIRIQYDSSSSSSSSFIKTVQKSSEGALSHAVPWDQLLSHLKLPATEFPNHPLFDVMVTFHEASQEVRLSLPGARFVPTWSTGAKFKLMAEFTARADGELSLRLEYSDECFTADEVRLVARLVYEALDGLISGDEYGMIARRLGRISGC